jgi:hypothetical protein
MQFVRNELGGKLPARTRFRQGRHAVSENYVAADPYPWPFDGDLRPAKAAPLTAAKACCRTPSNKETPGLAGRRAVHSEREARVPAYFRAGWECGYDAFAVPVGKHTISAISPTPSGQTQLSFPLLLNPRTLD